MIELRVYCVDDEWILIVIVKSIVIVNYDGEIFLFWYLLNFCIFVKLINVLKFMGKII